MNNFIKKYSIQLNLLLALTIGLVILSTIFYYLIPFVLNYPAGTFANSFQTELENTNYFFQTVCIALSIFVIYAIITFTKTRFLITYNDMFSNPLKYSLKELNYVKDKLLNVPFNLLVLNIIIPSISLTIIHAFTIHQFGITTFKLFLLIISIVTLYVTSVFIYTCSLFKRLLAKLPYNQTTSIKKSSLYKRLSYNIFPLILVSILFTSLIGYSIVSKEVSNYLFNTYRTSLKNFDSCHTFTNENELKNSLNEISLLNDEDIIFIKLPDGIYLDKNLNKIEMSNFFNKYLTELSPSNKGRVYEYYGIDSQAATVSVEIDGSTYIIGVYYNVLSFDILLSFGITFLILLIFNIIILYLFSRSLSNDINIITNNFEAMINNKDENLMKCLPYTANDEIGELIILYNKLQILNAKNINKIHSNQQILMEKERLASLGQLIGGIAHNLKTPIMSISGATEGINDLIKEYQISIGDPDVTNDDHQEIVKDMSKWTTKIKNYTEYMSDIITAVKGQAVNFNNDVAVSFTIDELLKRIDILMKHELKHSLTYLNINLKTDSSHSINGDVNSLVQILNNMISNSIQAYKGTVEQTIDLIIEELDSMILISVKDYGCGIPKSVQNKLFKEMVTTKGKHGTGLGLYMSYSTIKGHFNGDITISSAPNKGTTFTIYIPVTKQEIV